jgi:Sperm-tail PG-rich repeat
LPGPGAYNPNIGSIKHLTPGSRIGTSKRSNLGASKDAALVPGPGNYALNESMNGHSAKIGTSKRAPLS